MSEIGRVFDALSLGERQKGGSPKRDDVNRAAADARRFKRKAPGL